MSTMHVHPMWLHDLQVEVALGRIREASTVNVETLESLAGVTLVSAPYMPQNRAVITVNGEVKAILKLEAEDEPE